jgi:hypothetical protein
MKAVFKILLLFSCIVGCDSTFNPDGPYKEKLVVYAVFSSRSDTQFVRVYTTSVSRNPSTAAGIPDARVMITQGDSIYQFRDTTVERNDSTLSPTRLKAYVAYRLHLTPGLRYGLSVTSPARGSVSSQASALYRGTMLTESSTSSSITVLVFPGVNARAHVVRMYLEYESRNDSVWVPGRIEIPRYVTATGEYVYPRPVSREIQRVNFDALSYASVVAGLRQQGLVRLLRTVFVLTQLDGTLYAYYSTVNGFPDTGTLRLDEPDYTNIDGGLGVFAMSSDTILLADTSGH